jgi:APA family basic amino acid/polyamine antiporter
VQQRAQLGVVDVASIVVGAIVGVGIFFTPAKVAAVAPSEAALVGAWALGGVIAALGALVLADLSALLPEAGGLYVFLREGFGRFGGLVAFGYGVINLCVVQPAASAIVAVLLVRNLEVLVGDLGGTGRAACAVASLALFAAINAVGLRTGSGVQLAVTVLKVVTIAALVAMGVMFGGGPHDPAGPVESAPVGASGWLGAAMIPILFSYGGWQHGSYVAGVARDARRTVPIGILAGVALVVVCYVSVVVAYLALLGHARMAGTGTLAADAAAAALGPWAERLVALAIAMSAAGILSTILLSFPWVVVAMARDGSLPAWFGVVDPARGTPTRAIATLAAGAILGVVLGGDTLDRLLAATSFGDWVFFALVAVAHLALWSRRDPAARVPIGRWVAVLFGLASAAVATSTIASRPCESGAAAAVLVAAAVWRWGRAAP